MKNLKKFFGMFLALCMVVGTMTLTAYADDGSIDAPWQLSTSSVRFYVYVAPGETQWVQVDDCNGTTVEVGYATNTDYMINYGKLNTYYPENADGQLSFTMQEGGDMFSVYNSGEDYVSVYMSLVEGTATDTTGTVFDPEELVLQTNFMGNLGAYVEKELAEKNEGYYWYVTAPADGILSIGINAIDADWNPVGWMWNVSNETAAKYGDSHKSDEEEPIYYEDVRVSEGDVVKVFLSTYNPEDMWSNPAGTVSVDVSFSKLGSWGCPDTVEIGTSKYELEEGSQGYYVQWTAKEAGSIIVSASGENGWQFNVNGEMADGSYYYGDTYASNDEVSSESVPVNKGDIITINVNTLMNEETWTCPAGTVTLDIEFVTIEEETEVTVTEEELEAVADGSVFSGLEENKEIVFSPSYGQNILSIKEFEATTLKDALYTALDISLLVHGDWGDYYTAFEEGEKAEIVMAIGELLKEAETVDVYTLENGVLTKLTSSEVVNGNITFDVSKAVTYVFVDATVEEEPSDDSVSKDDDTVSKDDDTVSKDENTTGEGTEESSKDNQITTPNTGDSSNVTMMLLLAAVAVVGGMIVMNTKRKEA